MATQLQEPVVARSSASVHSREEDEYKELNEENPLEVRSNASIQPTPSILERHDPLENAHGNHRDERPDDPPPPYEPMADAPQIAPVEYSCDNSPQLLQAPQSEFPEVVEPPPRNPARLSASQLPEVSPVQPLGSPASLTDPSLVPAAPLSVRSASSTGGIPQYSASPSQATPTTFSSAKAWEAGFEIEQPNSPQRSDSHVSSGSLPSITLLPSTETIKHTREPGKVTAYLIPFPKPRLKGVKPEDIPDRFLVYTPPLPPLSKPAPGEKESQWHKTQRVWQEDVRRATMTNASKASWQGMKARTTLLIGKGVNLTRSSNVEFLDRVSGGTISSTTEDIDANETAEPNANATTPELTPTQTPTELSDSPNTPTRASSSISMDKDTKHKALEDLTLIYPPSLLLSPEQIRIEFVDTLMRTREKSRKEAVVASSLLPFAAAVDASLLITFGGFTQVSGVWAYTSTRGAITSKKISKGLAIAEEQHKEEIETRGCTCGHHEHDFGHAETITKSKGKKKAISLQLQQSGNIEILRRYLDLACLKKDFSMFPTIEEAAGDVNEGSVLEAIGWRPVRRQGRDLELEFKDRVEKFTPEQDEQYQLREAKDDVKRIMRKGASEWVTWCKYFQKDPEAALKK